VPKSLMEPPPASPRAAEWNCRSGQAGRRLPVDHAVDVANLMKDQKLRDVQGSSHQRAAEEKAGETHQTDAGAPELSEVQLVTFLLGAEEYGIPISQIQEIDRLAKITKVPKAAQFIEGITNLRGEVIPVLDTRKRFDLEVKPSDDRTRIIIVDLGGVKTGLVVDSVREVLNLARKDIAPPPDAVGAGIDSSSFPASARWMRVSG